MVGQASPLVIIMSGEDARPTSYSNKSRGLREKQDNLTPDGQPLDKTHEAIEIIDVSEYKPCRIPSKQWRGCIKKIYEADPLCCPKCGGEMKIISFITDQHEPVYELFNDLSAFNEHADA